VTIAYVGLGSNLEEPEQQVRKAFDELASLQGARLTARSSLYRTAPVGYAAQPDFINAVAMLETSLSAEELFGQLKAIEGRHSRQRSFANAPRTLDLDLLLFGDRTLKTADLVVPHPRMHERAFVLQPLVEIASELTIPGIGSARQQLARCADQHVERIA
jgi:2-amino-4-hydroxy-6-hydroxymethyldihydropteridine diphosphokinase